MYSLKDGLKNDTTFQISDSEKLSKISKKSPKILNAYNIVVYAATYAHWQRVKDARGSAKTRYFVRILQLKPLVASVSFCSSGLIIRHRKTKEYMRSTVAGLIPI